MKGKIVISLNIDQTSQELPEPCDLVKSIIKAVSSVPCVKALGGDLYNLSTHEFIVGCGEQYVDEVVLTESLKKDQEVLG